MRHPGSRRIRSAGISIIAISGNHDSAPRLGAFADFLAAGGLHLRTAAARAGEAVLICRPRRSGRLLPGALPRTRPRPRHLGPAGPGQPSAGADQGAASRRGPISRRARREPGRWCWPMPSSPARQPADRNGRSPSAGVESVTADVFDGFDYVALGHLHSSQRVSRSHPLFGIAAAVRLLRGRADQERPAGRPRPAPASVTVRTARPAGDPPAGHRARHAGRDPRTPQPISRMPTCRSN